MIKQKQQGDLIRQQNIRLIELEIEARRQKAWARYLRKQLQNVTEGKGIDSLKHIKEKHSDDLIELTRTYKKNEEETRYAINVLSSDVEKMREKISFKESKILELEQENRDLNCRLINRTKEMENQKIKAAACFLSMVIFAAIAAYVIIAH